jgi:hypothetical protein
MKRDYVTFMPKPDAITAVEKLAVAHLSLLPALVASHAVRWKDCRGNDRFSRPQ